jgi:hypothetical protein
MQYTVRLDQDTCYSEYNLALSTQDSIEFINGKGDHWTVDFNAGCPFASTHFDDSNPGTSNITGPAGQKGRFKYKIVIQKPVDGPMTLDPIVIVK